MPIDRDEVLWIAGLARLELPPDEVDALRNQLQSILEHVAVLETLELEAPTAADADAPDSPLRADEPRGDGCSREQALANAPDTAEGQFRVPQVIDP